ncbi:MAG: polysaccharide biosynthesis protein [Pseudomonadota bacterium]
MRFSIKHNLIANYSSQLYVMGVGVVMAPVYLSYMGQEAYGLIGFFTVMSAWFQLLDIGLTPALVRETARFRGGAISVNTLRSMLRALEVFFGAVSIAGGAAIVFLSKEVATHWLKVEHLPVEEVAQAVVLMGLAIPLRFIAGLYRGVVNGFERQVWLGGYNIAIATLRFIGVLGIFAILGATPENFFAYQLVLAAIELGGLTWMTYRLVRRGAVAREDFSWGPFKANLAFSLTIAFTATVWLALIQTDRMVLSKTLTLSAYGVFSIAIVAAATVSALNGALGQAILPRLTKFAAESDTAGMTRLYRDATQTACVIAAPVVGILAFFANPVLATWTGRLSVAHEAAPILRLYAIGNGLAWLSSFPYYLQYAKGNLRLHLIGNTIQLLFLVPLIFLAAERYGPIGTGAVWALANGLFFLIYVPIVHARFFPGNHWKWVLEDILSIGVPVMAAAWLFSALLPQHLGRWLEFAAIIGTGVILLLIAGAASATIRTRVLALIGVSRTPMRSNRS